MFSPPEIGTVTNIVEISRVFVDTSEEELSLFPQFSIVLVSRDRSEDKLCSVLIVCHPGVSRPHCTLGKQPVEN